jgi:hypothetical protein
MVHGQPRQKILPVIPATSGSIKRRRSKGQDGPEQKARSYLQNNQRRKGWRCGSSIRVLA